MSTNTELIARLRNVSLRCGGFQDVETLQLAINKINAIEVLEAQLKNASVAAIAEAAEVDRMKAEVERLTTLAHGQHIELYNARLQLAAAQGQPVRDALEEAVGLCDDDNTANAIRALIKEI